MSTSAPSEYDLELEAAVKLAIADGYRTFSEVCLRTEGADPRLVHEIFERLVESADRAEAEVSVSHTTYRSRRIPAADPFLSQWWFRDRTTRHIARLAHQAASRVDSKAPRVAFLGSPTVGLHYSFVHGPALILDADPDLVGLIRSGRRIVYRV